MHLTTIRARLTFWYTSLLTLSFLVLGGTGYGLLSFSLSQESDAALRGVAQTLAERGGGGAESFIPSEIEEVFRRFFGFSPLERYFERLPFQPSVRGGKLPSSEQAVKNASRGIPTFETLEGLGPYPVRVLTWPVVKAGRVSGVIQVGMSRENLDKTLRRLLFLDFGRVRQYVKAAVARRDGAIAQYQEAILRALAETENALAGFRAANQSEDELRADAAAAAEAAKLSRMRYDVGATDYLTLLDAERTMLDLEDRHVQAESRRATALAALYKALAGDF